MTQFPQTGRFFSAVLTSERRPGPGWRGPVVLERPARMDYSTPGFPVHHQLLELLKLMSIESVMPSSHLILCHPLLLLPNPR